MICLKMFKNLHHKLSKENPLYLSKIRLIIKKEKINPSILLDKIIKLRKAK